MIFHDRVILSTQVPFDPPSTDLSGNPLYDTSSLEVVPADVTALPGDEVMSDDRVNVVSRYRMVLAPQLDIPEDIGAAASITWRGVAYEVDGSVKRRMVRASYTTTSYSPSA